MQQNSLTPLHKTGLAAPLQAVCIVSPPSQMPGDGGRGFFSREEIYMNFLNYHIL
jgi:hypothetical protein